MEELVQAFAEGQMSRRVFIRRAVATGATLTGAAMFADLILANPAQAMTQYEYVFDYSFSPDPLRLDYPDDYVYWQWNGASGHSVTDTSGLNIFDSSPVLNPTPPPVYNWVTDFGFGFWAAGRYEYECKDTSHVPMNGVILSPVLVQKTNARSTAMVQWGNRDLSNDPFHPNLRYDVQVKKPGQQWATWRDGVGGFTATYRTRKEGRHYFRGRLRNINTQVALGWSPRSSFNA
ncbi:MAG: hypothetical protein WD004_05640 [Actinomycetota bacterium]